MANNTEALGFLLLIGSNLVLVALVLFVFFVLSRALSRRDVALTATTEQFASISQQLAELRRLAATPPAAPVPDEDATALLQDMMADLDPQGLAPIDRALSQGLGLVSAIQGVSDAQYPAWKAAHQGQIDELVARRDRLEHDVTDLKEKLERAHRLVTTLHAKNRRLSGAQGQVDHLEVMNNALHEELNKAKQKRRELEQELEQRHGLLAEKHAELAKATGLLQVQAQQQEKLQQHWQAEIDALRNELLKEREVLSRTLVEKDFVETVYIETDAKIDELKLLQRELQRLTQENQALQAQLNPAGEGRIGLPLSASPTTPPR